MSIGWIFLVACVPASWLFAHLVFKPWLRKNRLKKAEAGTATDAVVKETCDIYGKTGAVIRYDCGHDDAEEFRIDLYGEPAIHKKPKVGRLLCSDCLLAKVLSVSRRCGACGFAIMPGHPVALCVDDRRIGKKAWKTVRDGQLLVCLRWECDNGPGFCGHWTGDGIKPAFPNGGNVISQVFNSGEAMGVEIGPLEPDEPPIE